MKRVLVDRHHAGLFYSLQRLFEDRLGMRVYTPIGRAWWDEGYWRFGEVYGDERLVAQYLEADGWEGRGSLATTRDRDYPERPIFGVGLPRAQAMRWDYVVATVQENQPGFARFAREHNARYVYQVGNTRQQVDWSLDPIVLASSEGEVRKGVRYLQEMHEAYRWRDPAEADPHRIASFVNLMPKIECWPTLWQHSRALPEFTFRVYGADCPDGIVQPTTAVADEMARSGWGWHDKVTGDGFGHVLWGWAAIGRPVIGHGSHYRGQLGEVFWRDGETCIDLDLHPDASEVLRSITPARHREMCEAIRAVFEEWYDPERDAAAIAEVLR